MQSPSVPLRGAALPATPATTARPIVVYDDGCRSCRRSMRAIRAFDWLRRLDHMPYSRAVRIYPEVARGVLGDGLRVRFPDATVTIGIDAVRSICIRTPMGFVPGLLLYVPPLRAIGDRAYRRIAARRGRDSCDVPGEDRQD